MMNHFQFAMVASLCVFTHAYAFDQDKAVDVQQVQTVLKQKNAQWTAKESWVSKLSKAEAHRLLGAKHVQKGALTFDTIESPNTRSPKTKASLDWRDNGGNWLGPILNQGNCGSCVAFASIGTLEAQTTISTGLPWIHPTYSPQYLFACGGASCDSGWDAGSAADFMQQTGVPDEACMPYTSGSTGNDVSCSDSCANASKRTVQISGYSHIDSSASAVKAALAKGPLMTSMMAYDDFMVYSSGVYKHTTGGNPGGHEVSIVGYDDTKQAWLIRNSWGTEWGMNGYAWMAYDDEDSGVGTDSYSITLTPAGNYVSVETPSDRQYLSGTASLVAEVSTGDASVEFTVTDDKGKVTSVPCQATSGTNICTASFDTTSVAEGHYTVSAQSTSGKVTSQTREFFVLNSVPKMSLSFKAASDTDLSKVNGGQADNRPEFILNATSSPVPFQHVIFQVIDSSGNVVSTKDSDFIVPNMDVGWRTMEAPNGVYTIKFHGEITYNGKLYTADSNSAKLTVQN